MKKQSGSRILKGHFVISVEEVHLNLQRSGAVVHHFGSSVAGNGVSHGGAGSISTVCLWLLWLATMLLGLGMKNRTNEQGSLRPSLPRERKTNPAICWSGGKQLSRTASTKHFCFEISAFLLIFRCASTFPAVIELLGARYSRLNISHLSIILMASLLQNGPNSSSAALSCSLQHRTSPGPAASSGLTWEPAHTHSSHWVERWRRGWGAQQQKGTPHQMHFGEERCSADCFCCAFAFMNITRTQSHRCSSFLYYCKMNIIIMIIRMDARSNFNYKKKHPLSFI